MKSLLFAVAIAAAILGWQLFVDPIVGLADQGDFQKILGPLGYAPVPKGPEHKYFFLTRRFVKDPSYRQPGFEQITSEFVLAAPAILLYSALVDPHGFDLTLIGLSHTLLFLIALARLLYVTQAVVVWPVVWTLTLLVLTDVGYAAYWNSLYTEPASCIWYLLLLSECISFCTGQSITTSAVLRFGVFSMLLICSKTQNALLCIPIGAYLLAAAMRNGSRIRYTSFAVVAALFAAGLVMYRSLLPAPKIISLYDMVFYGILPESPNPKADLAVLGLNPDYSRYAGTLPWSEDTGVVDGALVNALQQKVTPFNLVSFFAARPARMLHYVEKRMPAYLSLRPEFCGNYEESAGRLPGARSQAVALWSNLHDKILSPAGLFIVPALPLLVVAGILRLLPKRRSTVTRRCWIELATYLVACCFTSFFVAAFGDSYDNTKHQYLFNLLLDTCLVYAIASAAAAVRRRTDLAVKRPDAF